MYQYIDTVSRSRSIGAQWRNTPLADVSVQAIFDQYSKVFLILQYNDYPDPVYVDLDTLKAEFSSYIRPLSDLLMQIGERVLVYVPKIPSTRVTTVRYSDAFRSEYKVAPCKIGVETPPGYPESDLQDLVLTRPRYPTDMSLIQSHCLVSVNGFYHMTETDGTKAYIYQGGQTMRHAHFNHLGILSFLDIGRLTATWIHPDAIYGHPGLPSLRSRVCFDIDPTVVLDARSYVLVLGGYLVFPADGVFWRSGDHAFSLDLQHLPYLERLYESQHFIDLPAEIDVTNIQDSWNDDAIRAYLSMSQTFLVTVETAELILNRIHLRHSSLPGMFTAYQDPMYPLITAYGRVAEYWKTFEDGYWAVSVQDSFYRNFVISKNQSSLTGTVNDHLIPSSPYFHSKGYLLEIAGYKA